MFPRFTDTVPLVSCFRARFPRRKIVLLKFCFIQGRPLEAFCVAGAGIFGIRHESAQVRLLKFWFNSGCVFWGSQGTNLDSLGGSLPNLP